MKIEERMKLFEVSLLNAPVVEPVIVEPLSALEKARMSWRTAYLIEGRS
jgi:hypothetical protein